MMDAVEIMRRYLADHNLNLNDYVQLNDALRLMTESEYELIKAEIDVVGASAFVGMVRQGNQIHNNCN